MAHKVTAAQTRLMHMSGYDVEVTRKAVRNLNLRVRRDGSVVLSIPTRATLADAESFVRERAGWIEAHRARALASGSKGHAWTDGDAAMVWGETLTIAVVADADVRSEHARRVGPTLELHVSAAHAGMDDEACARRAAIFDAYLAVEMRDALRTLLPSCEAHVGKRASGIRLRRMVSRWGSCNVETARITLNLALGERAPACLETVLCHELCHLHERGHNRRFYAHLDAACPDWRKAHAQLRETPPRR